MNIQAAVPTSLRPSRIGLGAALRLDAVVTGANGVAYLAAAGPVGDLLGLSPSLLRGAGAFLVLFSVLVWLAPRALVPAVVAANGAWAAMSIAAVLADWGTPSTAGSVWIVLQAIVVAGFAELQLAALRRSEG
jgi:hypothetical protein